MNCPRSEEPALNDIYEPKSINASMNDVVVIGAGPAGLMLASNLVRFGIRTTIIDDRSDRTKTGRADGLQPKSIETFKQLRLAGPLLEKGVRVYDISFWDTPANAPPRRMGRECHYPPGVIDVQDPFTLLVHQGVVENVFVQDLKSRGVEVHRSCPFKQYSTEAKSGLMHVEFDDLKTSQLKVLKTQYLVGCDGAHSAVRKSMLGAEMDGESGRSAWGVLDGIIETDFPDRWSKSVISSERAGSILCVPREKNLTRLYIELTATAPLNSEAATEEFVRRTAKEIMRPFKLEWKSVEWFGIYKVGQRVAKRFSDDAEKIFIAGDAAHTHSPKAAQGMNVSLHDAFNLAWKLNLAARGLAAPSLVSTYEQERRKIAHDLIEFDYEHSRAFAAGDTRALAQNFVKNIRFISGVGAEYAENVLNIPEIAFPFLKEPRGSLRAGHLMLPAKVSRYTDGNPVDIQIDIPILGQFRIFFFTANVKSASAFLSQVCEEASSTRTILGRVTAAAELSYANSSPVVTEMEEFVQPERYTPVSKVFTYATVTTMSKHEVEISDLPPVLENSCWTFYLDDIMTKPSCTEKWVGELEEHEVVIVNVRPDGYVGRIGRWNAIDVGSGEKAAKWLDEYYSGFLKA